MPTDTMISTPTASRSRVMLSQSTLPSSSIAIFACGAAAGLAVGAALALLYAPMTGSAMRSRVRTLANDGSSRLQELVASGRTLAEDALHQTTAALDAGRRAFRTSRAASSPESLRSTVTNPSSTSYRFDEPLGG